VSRAKQKDATRTRIWTTAMRLFDERGYDAVNIEDVVREAKIARGTFYVHFPTKDDVLVELIHRNDAKICAGMRSAARRSRSLRAVLKATTDGFAGVWRNRRALLPHAGAVAMRRIAGVAHERDAQPLRLELVEHIARAVDAGDLRATMPPQMLADVFLLDVFAALMAWSRTGAPSLTVVMDGVIELYLRGAGRAVRSRR
jgi:AcrR family transcriptional regulator